MPKASDITGGMRQLKGLKTVNPHKQPPPNAGKGRKLRVDWFFRGAWIVLGLIIFAQFILLGNSFFQAAGD